MSFIVREITKRAGGGEIVRPVKHDVPVLTVGRSSDNIIPLADLAVLPHHATITMREGQVHVEALVAAKRPVVFVLDGDAWEESWAWGMKLRFLGARSGSVRLPPRMDPDEMDRSWLDAEAVLALSR